MKPSSEAVQRRAFRLIRRVGPGFHWDTPATGYTSPLWRGAQREIDRAFEALEAAGIEPYGFGCKVIEAIIERRAER